MSEPKKPLTWLITGSSAGFGFELAKHALSRGHNVIATSRNPSKTPDLVKQIMPDANDSRRRGHWLQLDVTSSQAEIDKQIKTAEGVFGRIDVLVNNAGYSHLGAFEDMPEDALARMFAVNYWGLMRVTKAALPGLRANKSAGKTIVNISSVAGLTAQPTCSAYSASKWAVEGLSQALSAELQPFDIRVLVVEPGGFRTRFYSPESLVHTPVSEPYKGTITDEVLQKFTSSASSHLGDPAKAAQCIVDVVTGEGLGAGKQDLLRLQLGSDCTTRVRGTLESITKDVDAAEEIAATTAWEE